MEPIGINDALIRELLAASREAKEAGHDDPFNLKKAGSINRVPHELNERFPHLVAAFQAAIAMSLRQGFSARREQLATVLEPCGSPIEARFLLGLICACPCMITASSSLNPTETKKFLSRKVLRGRASLVRHPAGTGGRLPHRFRVVLGP